MLRKTILSVLGSAGLVGIFALSFSFFRTSGMAASVWMKTTETTVPPTESTASPTTESTTEPTTEFNTEPNTEPTTKATTEPPTTEPPESVKLEIPYYTQRGVLPTGCELISAKMVLEYYTEEEIPIEDIIEKTRCQYPEAVDGETVAPHPEDAFIGHPTDPTSFGCFAPVIRKMMNHFLPSGYIAVETTGTDLQELAETYLPQGTPVIIWATINMVEVEQSDFLGWYIKGRNGYPTKEWYDWKINEHCLVLVGYDSDYYYFNDPNMWQSMTRFGRKLVEKRYNDIGMYSIIVQEAP